MASRISVTINQMHKYSILFIIKLLFVVLTALNNGYALNNIMSNSDNLLLSKNETKLSLMYNYSYETSFFDNNRNLLSIGNLSLNNSKLTLFFDYGFTRFLNFGFSFPFSYKDLNDSEGALSAATFGLSDATFNLKFWFYFFKPVNIILFTEVKFPSGSTYSGNGGKRELPLGNGQMESGDGLLLNKKIGNLLSLSSLLKYTSRVETVAEYREVTIIDSNGIVIDAGNQRVDFGDALSLSASFDLYLKKSFIIGLDSLFTYRFKTTVQGSSIPYFSEDTSIASDESDGYIFQINPHLIYSMSNNFEIYAGNSIPISGLRYPLVDLYNVDGLIGYINPTVTLNWYFDKETKN